jgi:hypothetical protein
MQLQCRCQESKHNLQCDPQAEGLSALNVRHSASVFLCSASEQQNETTIIKRIKNEETVQVLSLSVFPLWFGLEYWEFTVIPYFPFDMSFGT